MSFSISKWRVVGATLFVLAGVGLASILNPLVGSALATAGQVVNVSDPTAPNTAKVDASGKLNVGDGAGPLSVDGTVSDRPAAPASPWRAVHDVQATEGPGTPIAGPSSAPINLTSLSLSTDQPDGKQWHFYLFGDHVPNSATTCDNATRDVLLWHIGDLGDGRTPLSFTFPTPLQWKPPANTKACLFAFTYTDLPTSLNAVGFYGG